QTQLSKLVNNYKTVTSRLLRKEFSSALEKYYWKDLFWSDSYFLSTVSETTEEAVRIYIQEQGKRDNEGYRRHAGRRKAANPA
ncbi:transposase, partial [Galactobacillus timonensis]